MRAFIVRLTALLARAAYDLLKSESLEPGYRLALSQVVDREEGALYVRANEILAALDRGEFESPLADHGLAGGPETDLKMTAFDAALRRSRYRQRTRASLPPGYDGPEFAEVIFVSEREPQTEGRLRKLLSGLASAFVVANSVLRSLANAVPAAGAYGEIKDAIEAGVETVANAGGLLSKAGKFVKAVKFWGRPDEETPVVDQPPEPEPPLPTP
jgi:hypothetical protein